TITSRPSAAMRLTVSGEAPTRDSPASASRGTNTICPTASLTPVGDLGAQAPGMRPPRTGERAAACSAQQEAAQYDDDDEQDRRREIAGTREAAEGQRNQHRRGHQNAPFQDGHEERVRLVVLGIVHFGAGLYRTGRRMIGHRDLPLDKLSG